MKKILNIFFVTLGVIFFLLILLSIYLYVADPFNLKPLFNSLTGTEQVETDDAVGGQDKHPALSSEQEEALETVGVDPASLPTEITSEQEVCFEAVLGVERMAEIKAGATPTASEYFAARGCLE